jgi:hypothetical protein
MAMAAESFFARWSRQKTELPPVAPDAAVEPVAVDQPEPVLPPPTIEDVATLTPQSDYTRFIGKGVDENIQRAALKKLFTDPHFNIMDGLDIYIGDYNKFDPIPPEMLALLNHAKGLLDPLSQFENPLMRLMEEATSPEAEPAPAEEAAAAKNTTDIVSASVESPSEGPMKGDTNRPLPHDAVPTQTLTEHDDDHKI